MNGQPITRKDVARGAGLAGLARAAAVIELFAQSIYTWLFGLATYGIYVVLWGAINLLTNFIDLSMQNAVQRCIPTEREAREDYAHGVAKCALLISVIPAAIAALVISLNAARVSTIFSVAPADRADLPTAVALFAWGLPLWTFVEVATSLVRARHAFGPEIRLRIFWEQIARILFAVLFFALGLRSLGLVAAHLCSLAITALLCVRLMGRYYDLRLLCRVAVPPELLGHLVGTGLALLPANLLRRMLIDAPPLMLNLIIPGAQGARAAGLFEIARKIASVPQIIRQAFQYVLAPLAAAQARLDRASIGGLYQFAVRVSSALTVPLCGLLIFAGADILSLFRPEIAVALPLIYVLVSARLLEGIGSPASTVVEMTGHRLLSPLNSLVGAGLWLLIAALLTPKMGAVGMAIAVSAGTLATVYAAVIELRVSDGLSPFDQKLFQGLAVSFCGIAVMGLAEYLADGPLRFALVMLIWAATSWFTLRFGLGLEDRRALGSVATRLGLAS